MDDLNQDFLSADIRRGPTRIGDNLSSRPVSTRRKFAIYDLVSGFVVRANCPDDSFLIADPEPEDSIDPDEWDMKYDPI